MIDGFLSRAISFTWILCLAGSLAQDQNQLLNLAEAPKTPRFPLTDRVWGANPGDASICLWADDKLAAVSFTVDDNPAADVAWWLETADQYGFKVTWFLITDRIEKNPSTRSSGTWKQWSEVITLGHDIQSHTVWHLHTELPEWTGIEDEYRLAGSHIETKIPGHLCECLAYPGGANKGLNDRNIAARYYIAARGAAGSPNPANQIDYLNTCAMSKAVINDPALPWADLNNLFKPGNMRYRGWAVLLSHSLPDKSTMTPLLGFFAEHKDELWGGLFRDVAKYGQERDTATLKVDENTPLRIALTLTDRMLDSRFDYPLTVKVCLPSEWKNVKAAQNGQAVASRLVEHEGALYALVNAVPDRGQIILMPVSL